jgi:acyl-CoA oxidase
MLSFMSPIYIFRYIRSVMIHGMGQHLGQVATIATRYSCVRRQGTIVGEDEVKILDYTTQQYRILPHISRAFCFMLAGDYIRALYYQNMEQVKSGDVLLIY